MRLRNKKTGEIVERSSIVTLRYKISSSSSSLVEAEEFGSIEQLYEEWEDCKPAEPLIKDKKIRKAVRAWAEACEINSALVYHSFFDTFLTLQSGVKIISFQVETPKELEFGKEYTIIELCGEEEECES